MVKKFIQLRNWELIPHRDLVNYSTVYTFSKSHLLQSPKSRYCTRTKALSWHHISIITNITLIVLIVVVKNVHLLIIALFQKLPQLKHVKRGLSVTQYKTTY